MNRIEQLIVYRISSSSRVLLLIEVSNLARVIQSSASPPNRRNFGLIDKLGGEHIGARDGIDENATDGDSREYPIDALIAAATTSRPRRTFSGKPPPMLGGEVPLDGDS